MIYHSEYLIDYLIIISDFEFLYLLFQIIDLIIILIMMFINSFLNN